MNHMMFLTALLFARCINRCTLTVRPRTVAGFVSLVGMLDFSRACTSDYGTPA